MKKQGTRLTSRQQPLEGIRLLTHILQSLLRYPHLAYDMCRLLVRRRREAVTSDLRFEPVEPEGEGYQRICFHDVVSSGEARRGELRL